MVTLLVSLAAPQYMGSLEPVVAALRLVSSCLRFHPLYCHLPVYPPSNIWVTRASAQPRDQHRGVNAAEVHVQLALPQFEGVLPSRSVTLECISLPPLTIL